MRFTTSLSKSVEVLRMFSMRARFAAVCRRFIFFKAVLFCSVLFCLVSC